MLSSGSKIWIIGSGLGYSRTGEVRDGEYVFSYIPVSGETLHPFEHIAFPEEYQVQEFLSCLYRQSRKWFIDWTLSRTHLIYHPSWKAIHQYMWYLEHRIKKEGRQHVTL